jgi:hypothetical protein
MATIPTSIGPIGARQINNSLYVGHNDLTTIQKAVSFAVAAGGIFTVCISPEYTGGDTISTVTGGSPTIAILDLRNLQWQSYEWNGTNYVAADFHQLGNLGVNGVAEVTGQLQAYGGAATEIIYVGQTPAVAGAKVVYIATNPTDDTCTIQSETIQGIYDQTLLLNPLGGAVQIGSGVSIDHLGTITAASGHITGDLIVDDEVSAASGHITGDLIVDDEVSAASAEFSACQVASSPVRTFANTPDGPGQGMVWPTAGIAVSLGSTWQNPSINPTSLATLSNPTTLSPSITSSSLLVPVSSVTTAQANTSIDTNSHIFNLFGTARPSIAGTPAASTSYVTLSASAGQATTGTTGQVGAKGDTFTIGAGNGGAAPAGSTNGAGGDAYLSGGAAGIGAGTAGTRGDVYIQSNGGSTYLGTTVARVKFAAGVITFNPTYINGSISSITTPHGNIQFTSWNTGNNTATGGYQFDAFSADFSHTITYLNMYSDATTGAFTVTFPNTGITVGGTITGNGLAISGSKVFFIQHPLDETKNLVHACLEGPENGIFYRGEDATAGGWVEINLPDYFEALAMKDNRSVLLTPLFEDESEQVGVLAASRVKDGKFKVWSALPAQKFYWEVKAVRGDIAPLGVEPLKEETNA